MPQKNGMKSHFSERLKGNTGGAFGEDLPAGGKFLYTLLRYYGTKPVTMTAAWQSHWRVQPGATPRAGHPTQGCIVPILKN
jgi:hypothetical protein